MYWVIFLIIMIILVVISVYGYLQKPINSPCFCQEPAWYQTCSSGIKGSEGCQELVGRGDNIINSALGVGKTFRSIMRKLPDLPPHISPITLPRAEMMRLDRIYGLDSLSSGIRSYSCSIGLGSLGDLLKFGIDMTLEVAKELFNAALNGDIGAMKNLLNSGSEYAMQMIKNLIDVGDIPMLGELIKLGSLDATTKLIGLGINNPVAKSVIENVSKVLPLEHTGVAGEFIKGGGTAAFNVAGRLIGNYDKIPGAGKLITGATKLYSVGSTQFNKGVDLIGDNMGKIPGAGEFMNKLPMTAGFDPSKLNSIPALELLSRLGSIPALKSLVNKIPINIRGLSDLTNLRNNPVGQALGRLVDVMPINHFSKFGDLKDNPLLIATKMGNIVAAGKLVNNINNFGGAPSVQYLFNKFPIGSNVTNKVLDIVGGYAHQIPGAGIFVSNLKDIASINKLAKLGNVDAVMNLGGKIVKGVPGAQEAMDVLTNGIEFVKFDKALAKMINLGGFGGKWAGLLTQYPSNYLQIYQHLVFDAHNHQLYPKPYSSHSILSETY